MNNQNSRKVTVLYGTQTGNSEDIAGRIARQLTRMHCKVVITDIKDFVVGRLIEKNVVIFVCSTTGNGEFPDSMLSFWRFLLRRDLPKDSLNHMSYCVFGLGDSSYDKFNVVAKKLNKRLLQLGASELLPLTLADDQHEVGYDGALDPWLIELKDALNNHFDISEPDMSDNDPLPPKFRVKFCNDENLSRNNFLRPPPQEDLPFAELKRNERVTPTDHFQAVHILEFKFKENIQFSPGDVAVVYPLNPRDEVKEFLDLINVSHENKFLLEPTDPEVSLPNINPYPCTVKELAESYFDFMSVPRRSFFEFMHYFSNDELEKEKLCEFTTAAGQEELYDYCNRPRRTILEVLQDFPQTTPNIPFDYFFDMIPPIRPRSFSIASALSAHKHEFHLLVAVVNYRTRLRKPRKGLCSNWITGLEVGSSIPFSVKSGSISLIRSNDPIIMIGPGTGVAPFRAFCEDRAAKEKPENYLFFGCRYKSKDFYFENTWKELCNSEKLTLFTAFSRDEDDGNYVQQKIREKSNLMWSLIHDENATVYIAGNAKRMPQGVKDAFLDIIKDKGDLDDSAAEKYIEILEKNKRYQMETWA